MNNKYTVKYGHWGDRINTRVMGYDVMMYRQHNGQVIYHVDLPVHYYNHDTGEIQPEYYLPARGNLVTYTGVTINPTYTGGYVSGIWAKYYHDATVMNYYPTHTARRLPVKWLVNTLAPIVLDWIVTARNEQGYINEVYRVGLTCARCNDSRVDCNCPVCWGCITEEICEYCNQCRLCCPGYHYVYPSW